MSILRVYLSPISKTSLRVITEPFSETDSTIPFDGLDNRRITMLKALNAESFNPFDFPGEDEQRWMIAEKLLVDDGSGRSFHTDIYKNIGKALYSSLFPSGSSAEEELKIARYNAKKSRKQLHLQIAIKDDVARQARLFDYPWELLCDEKEFLATQGIAISRYIEYKDPLPNIPALEQINVLLVTSRAIDLDPNVNLKPLTDDEYQATYQALQKAAEEGLLQLDELKHVTVQSLENYLIEHREKNTPYIIHFDGHGHFGMLCKHVSTVGEGECSTFHPGILTKKCRRCGSDLPNPQGYLLFEGGPRGCSYVSAGHLGSILGLANQSNRPGRGIAVVVLSACKSSMAQAEDSVFNGVAQSLISQQIPAVVGMAFSVNTVSTTNFAERFYRALGEKLPLALAINWGRLAMDNGYEGNQWYRPALYLRWKDNEGGRIFTRQSKGRSAGKAKKEKQTTKPGERTQRNPMNLHLVSPAHPQANETLDQASSVLASAIAYNKEIVSKQVALIPIYLLFGYSTDEDIPSERYELIANSPLLGIEDIWPEHCNLAIAPLQNIAQPIQSFYDLLDRAFTSNESIEAIQLYFSLETPLRLSSGLIKNLISQILKFKEVCQTPSREMLDKRRAIRDNLKSLRENLDQMITTMNSYS